MDDDIAREIVQLRRRVERLEAQDPLRPIVAGSPYATDALFCCHFDGPEPFTTDYSLNTTGHRGQVASITGGVIGRPGRFGKAVQTGEATTNLVKNPSVETNTNDWSFSDDGTSPIRARNVNAAYMGGYGLRWVIGSAPAATPYMWIDTGHAPAKGAVYTASLYIKGIGSAVGNSCRLYLQERGGAAANVSSYDDYRPLTAEWQRRSVTHAVQSAGRTGIWPFLRFESGEATAGTQIYIDCVQLEESGYATPYCDGSLGPGHAWTGTAHASTSTRATAYLTYPNGGKEGVFRADRGTVTLWARPTQVGARQDLVLQAGDGSYVILRIDTSGALVAFWGPNGVSGPASAVEAGRWVHLALTRESSGRVALYVDGALYDSGNATGPFVWSDASPRFFVGSGSGINRFNGLIDDLVIVGRALDADEVRAVYESNAPVLVLTDHGPGVWA